MYMGGDGIFALLTLLPLIMYIVVIAFMIYFVIKVIKFMNRKLKLDQERNEKLDELMKALNQSERE